MHSNIWHRIGFSLIFATSLAITPQLSSAVEPTAEPPHSWTGFYIGIGGGFGMAHNEVDVAGTAFGMSHDEGEGEGEDEVVVEVPRTDFGANIDGFGSQSGLFTMNIGADYQVSRNFVVGAFFDYDWTEMQFSVSAAASNSFGGNVAINIASEIENQWALGLRMGYLATQSTLVYVSGGYTQASLSETLLSVSAETIPFIGSFSETLADSEVLSGYFIGGGIETKLTKTVSLKAEYRRSDFGTENLNLLPDLDALNTSVTTELDAAIQTGRFSINYRF